MRSYPYSRTANKAAIADRLAHHPRRITSLVVRQEFKRRLLKEAAYLLGLLERYKSFDEVQQHVIRLLGQWHQRKRTICLQTLAQVHADTDAERTERLGLYLRSLLVLGLKRFDQEVEEVRQVSGCACARQEVVEKVALHRYEFGTDKCSKTKSGTCGIQQFLAGHPELTNKIWQYLRNLPTEKKSSEIQNAEKFLEKVVSAPELAAKEDPCLRVGDLLIALESAGISHFFTLNSAESQHLCKALGQTLIVQPVDPSKPEIVCNADAEQWPEFGRKESAD